MRLLVILFCLSPLLSLGQEAKPLKLQFQAGHLFYNPRQETPSYSSSFQADVLLHYYARPQIGLGLGMGATVFEPGYLFPLYLDVRGDLLPNKRLSPHYYAQFGKVIEGFPEGEGILVGPIWRNNYEAQGEYTFAYGVGLRINTSADYDWIFSMGVRTLQLTETERWEWNGRTDRTKLSLQRISLAAGLRF